GAESGRVLRRTRGQLKASGTALGGDLILLLPLQVHHAGRRARGPHVHQINHVLPGHIHYQLILVVAGQQEAIAPFRSRTELSLAGRWINSNGFVGWVEVGQRRVVPEKAISLARQQERNRNVGVGLVQPDGNAANVENAFLMLSEAVLELIGRRYERLLDLPGLHLGERRDVEGLAPVPGLGQYGLSVPGEETYRARGLIHRDRDS